MDSLYFYFNGRKSEELGIYLVNVESGMKTTPFLAPKNIISEQIPGNDTPYVYGVERENLILNVTLSCLNGLWTIEKRRQLARWLDTETYEEFYSTDYVDKRYYVQYSGGIDLTHNGSQQGYIQVQFQNISPYAYSPMMQKRFNLSTITSPTIIDIENTGDAIVKPELWIYKVGKGDISMRNLSNGGSEFKFINIEDKEELYVDNENRHIETDMPLAYRFDNFNNNYLELVRGKNRLEVTGACKLMFQFQYILKG